MWRACHSGFSTLKERTHSHDFNGIFRRVISDIQKSVSPLSSPALAILANTEPSQMSTSYRSIFKEVIDNCISTQPPILTLSSGYLFFASQKERMAILDAVTNHLDCKRNTDPFVGTTYRAQNYDEETVTADRYYICDFIMTRIFSIQNNPDQLLIFFLSYLVNTLKHFKINSKNSILVSLSYESDIFVQDVPHVNFRAIDQSLLATNINLIDSFLQLFPSGYCADLYIEALELVSYFVLEVFHANPPICSGLAKRVLSLTNVCQFIHFCQLSLRFKAVVLDLLILLNDIDIKDRFVRNSILPYFSAQFFYDNQGLYLNQNHSKDVDFAFILVSKIFKLLTKNTLDVFIGAFVQNATNSVNSIFSILILSQRVRLEQALFDSARRTFADKPDMLMRVLAIYSKYQNRPSSFLVTTYKWNIHSLVLMYGILGMKTLRSYLSFLDPSFLIKDPRIIIYYISLLFVWGPTTFLSGLDLLINKIQSLPKKHFPPPYKKDFLSIDTQVFYPVFKNISELRSERPSQIGFRNCFPDILYHQNLTLASIFNFLCEDQGLILLFSLIEAHPMKSSYLGSLYRSILSMFFKDAFFNSYAAILKRLLESETIEVFIASHEFHPYSSVSDSFYQNVAVLLSVNDALLLSIYLSRVESSSLLMRRLHAQCRKFIQESIQVLSNNEPITSIPHYLNLQFCQKNLFTKQLKFINIPPFPQSYTFGDLCEKLEHIDGLSLDEKHRLAFAVCKKPFLRQIESAFTTLKENLPMF